MHQRRTFLSVLTCSLALAATARAADPRALARRLELWAKAAAGTRALVARYALTRQSSLLQTPLTVNGTLAARSPDALTLRDDARDGATTRLTRGRLEIRPNDPELPALDTASPPAATWLFEHLLALFATPPGAPDPAAALRVDARLSIPRGGGLLLDLTPLREHPASREIRDLVVDLDPHTGDVDRVDLLELGGDKVTLVFSQRRRDVPEAELASLL
jgi:hypothetical protein